MRRIALALIAMMALSIVAVAELELKLEPGAIVVKDKETCMLLGLDGKLQAVITPSGNSKLTCHGEWDEETMGDLPEPLPYKQNADGFCPVFDADGSIVYGNGFALITPSGNWVIQCHSI